MSSNLPVVLEPQSFAELKRLVFQQQRELTSLRRSLQHVSVRRHQAVWMPSSAAYYSFSVGSYTITTDARTHITTGATITPANGQSYGNADITHSSGVITFTRDSSWTYQLRGIFQIDYKRNDYSTWRIEVQVSTDGGSVWNTTIDVDCHSVWPDVALVAGNGAYNIEEVASEWRRADMLAGYQIRITSLGVGYGSVRPGGFLAAKLSLFDSISTKDQET